MCKIFIFIDCQLYYILEFILILIELKRILATYIYHVTFEAQYFLDSLTNLLLNIFIYKL